MITYKIAPAIEPGDEIVIWWPDWISRTAVVIEVTPAVYREGKGEIPEVWKITVQFLHDNTRFMRTDIYRGRSEMLAVIVKNSGKLNPAVSVRQETAKSRKRGNSKRIMEREAAKEWVDPTEEDVLLTDEYEREKDG